VIVGFKDDTTRDIFDGVNSKAARKVPMQVWEAAGRKLDMLNTASQIKDLAAPPGNRLEFLKGHLAGRYSIRINDQYRIVFGFANGNVTDAWITDYH